MTTPCARTLSRRTRPSSTRSAKGTSHLHDCTLHHKNERERERDLTRAIDVDDDRHIPRELYRGRARVEVNLVDCKDRNWEAPKVVMKPFSGSGKRLGSTYVVSATMDGNNTTVTSSSLTCLLCACVIAQWPHSGAGASLGSGGTGCNEYGTYRNGGSRSIGTTDHDPDSLEWRRETGSAL